MVSCDTNTRWRAISASTTTQAASAPPSTTSPARSTTAASDIGASLRGRLVSGVGMVALLVPGLTALHSRTRSDVLIGIVAVVVAAATAVLVARVARPVPLLGIALVVAGAWLLSQAGPGSIAWAVAVVVGAGSGLVLARGAGLSSRVPAVG